jgi:hypothetical protein
VKSWASCDVDCEDAVLESGTTSDWSGDVVINNDLQIIGRLGVSEAGSVTQETPTATSAFVEIELALVATAPNNLPVSFSVEAGGEKVDLVLADGNQNIGSKSNDVIGWTKRVAGSDEYFAYVTVPGEAYVGSFSVSFIAGNEFGIKGYKVSAVCTKPEGARKLDEEDSSLQPPVGEPGVDGEDYSYYCLASDFPCDGGVDFVHVCHYSSRLGYQTFCIPESDSEVLRFYAKDYCGPCVGGFASA